MTTSEKVIKNKLGLLELSQQLGNVSRAYFSIRRAIEKKRGKSADFFSSGYCMFEILCLTLHSRQTRTLGGKNPARHT